MIPAKKSIFIFISSALLCSGCAPLYDFGGNHPPVVMPSQTQAAALDQVQQKDLPAPIDTQGLHVNGEGTYNTSYDAKNTTPDNIALKSVVGVWRATIDGKSCQLATPLTKFGKGYRAGPIHCPSSFSHIRSWSIQDNHLVFFDAAGLVTATLYASGPNSFVGQTNMGNSVALSR